MCDIENKTLCQISNYYELGTVNREGSFLLILLECDTLILSVIAASDLNFIASKNNIVCTQEGFNKS